jgi:hypothetical protein
MDAVDRLVAKLMPRLPTWKNGAFPRLDLPATATREQVVRLLLERIAFDRGGVSTHHILWTKEVDLGGEGYSAVVVDTNFGRKIVLLRYEGKATGWWSRVYSEGDE